MLHSDVPSPLENSSRLLPIDLFSIYEGMRVNGLVLISDYSKKLDFTSRAPLNGQLHYKGKSVNFKIWDRAIQEFFNNNDMKNVVLQISGTVGKYNDMIDITLETVNPNHGVMDVTQFYKSVDIDAVFSDFVTFVNSNLSQKGVAVLNQIFANERLTEDFKITWAAKKMHDAQVGGLMNHTLKMLKLAKTLIDNDPRLAQWSDLLYLSIIFHDIGKIWEMGQGGSYTTISFVGHRTIGVELLSRQKQVIVDNFDEIFFYHMLEVLTGHHGAEHGDKPKTVWALAIHLIDMLDSQVTGMIDMYTNGEVKERNGHKTVWNHGDNLVI